ncbi:hypothetical protein CVU76_01390 [Candidatus Dojkabacteria bacterium HGW-Dojkabacteria-1]|uniref:Uncharacterized protein n=1 Tax=Candidatus Dojkabacteria bacterium HGW-Dojkabacteria-1 TaxID=2013761 RepID=A0A2N2F376_9BACT|nr:MAG: hypothetical protein CVU76_01390 [Candidatus Dojkabacteria bacterium HGW-Dojkabacteria-1]
MDRFEELRKAQEGTLEQPNTTPEQEAVVSPQPSVSMEESVISTMSNEEKRAKTLNMILLVMVFAMIGLFAYLFFTDRLLLGVENPFSKQVVEEEEDIEEEKDEEEGSAVQMKEYVNTEFGVKFEYPESWVVQEDVVEGSLGLEIKERSANPDFVFVYSLPTASGPEICYFSDTENPEEIVIGTLYDNFFSINTDSSLRRTLWVSQGVSEYKVCKKDTNGNYTDWIQAGYVSYKVNMNRPDAQSMLKIMDDILLSFEYTGNI